MKNQEKEESQSLLEQIIEAAPANFCVISQELLRKNRYVNV
jgi:hypothetical protein